MTDPTIESVELKFDMMHRYFGEWMNFNLTLQRQCRCFSQSWFNPASLGEFTERVAGEGVVLSNVEITGADVGVELLGGTLADIMVDIDDPHSVSKPENNVY